MFSCAHLLSYHVLMQRRPADNNYNMVPPHQFDDYRKSRFLRYPCCLCADMRQQNYVELFVYSWQDEINGASVWKARCAMDHCGYQGQIFCLDYVHFFNLADYPVKLEKYFQLQLQSIRVYGLRG